MAFIPDKRPKSVMKLIIGKRLSNYGTWSKFVHDVAEEFNRDELRKVLGTMGIRILWNRQMRTQNFSIAADLKRSEDGEKNVLEEIDRTSLEAGTRTLNVRWVKSSKKGMMGTKSLKARSFARISRRHSKSVNLCTNSIKRDDDVYHFTSRN